MKKFYTPIFLVTIICWTNISICGIVQRQIDHNVYIILMNCSVLAKHQDFISIYLKVYINVISDELQTKSKLFLRDNEG